MEQRAHNSAGIGFSKGSRSRLSSPLIIGGIIAVIVVIALIIVFVLKPFSGTTGTFQESIKKNQYQAVFLTNGQVYFGKVAKIDNTSYTVSDIYYLQVQDGTQNVQKTADAKATDQNLSLAKLGSELHGPEDKMYIESKQVLFWENLKDDSRVVKAIQENKNK